MQNLRADLELQVVFASEVLMIRFDLFYYACPLTTVKVIA